jgi:hypothetical protein
VLPFLATAASAGGQTVRAAPLASAEAPGRDPTGPPAAADDVSGGPAFTSSRAEARRAMAPRPFTSRFG